MLDSSLFLEETNPPVRPQAIPATEKNEIQVAKVNNTNSYLRSPVSETRMISSLILDLLQLAAPSRDLQYVRIHLMYFPLETLGS